MDEAELSAVESEGKLMAKEWQNCGIDYSKMAFGRGLVCYNTNNQQYCVVLDGRRGQENDKAALVMEFSGRDGVIIHTPPNRALVPTGAVVNLDYIVRQIKGE